MISRSRKAGRENRRWRDVAAVLLGASFAALHAPNQARAQAAPGVTVRQEIVVRVPPVKRVVALADVREHLAANGARELSGEVRVSANVPCVLRVSAPDAAADYAVVPGVTELQWRLVSGARRGEIRYELVEARGGAAVRASSRR